MKRATGWGVFLAPPDSKWLQRCRPSLHRFRPELSPSIDDWVQQSLAVHPNERFQTITALFNAFRPVVGA
jgi:hypothetical protein